LSRFQKASVSGTVRLDQNDIAQSEKSVLDLRADG